MNNKLNNLSFFNFRNTLLILGSTILLAISFVVLYMQRNESIQIIDFSNIYIFITSTLILLLIISLSSLVLPILLRVLRKRVSTFNNKFTLYFISIALTPALFLGIISMMLINIGINDWFNKKIYNVIDNSVFVAESYLEEHKETIKGDVYAIYNDLNEMNENILLDQKKLTIALRTQALIRSLPETYIIDKKGSVVVSAFDDYNLLYNPPSNAFTRADNGEMTIMSSTQVNKVYALVKLKKIADSYLYVGRSMDANVISALNNTISAKNEYTFLESNRNQISIIFILTYIVITLIIILLSTLIGIRLAERVVSPISSIIKASNNISKGSYNTTIKKTDDYVELNRLADSFNKMSNDIVKQRNQILISKKHETWSEIARRIAHEIKNPLTPIQLSSERLEKKLNSINANNTDIDECMATIRRQVNEIGLLVDEFSSFARMPLPKLINTNICQIVANVISDHEKNNINISFNNKLHKKDLYIKIDKSQILRVIQNIVLNSIHSINENNENNGEIIINSSENETNLIISIIDNGIGLKYEKDELIKPYFTTKKKLGGSGLGLAIVEKILFDHRADFSIENRKDGKKGAEVIIKFEK